jgi:RHS repeat-associated protein
LITNYEGEEYERLEYTPYGELWIEKAAEASALDIAYRFTGKERDEETGNYYYGARYLDPRTSRWLSTDPAMGDYIPGAPINDEVKKRNGNLPGQGGVFNYANLHTYHYAGNNPVRYVDPDGRNPILPIVIALVEVGAISAAVSGTVDIGKQLWTSVKTGDFKYNPNQTWAAMAGGFVTGVLTGGAGKVAGLLKNPIASEAAIVGGGTLAGGVGSATTTAIDNGINNRPISENMIENIGTGTVAGALSTAVPSLSGATGFQDTAVKQSLLREGVKGSMNLAKDEVIASAVENFVNGMKKNEE